MGLNYKLGPIFMAKINVIGIDAAFSNIGLAFATVNLDNLSVELKDLRLIHTEAIKVKGGRKNSDDLRRARIGYHGIKQAIIDFNADVVVVEVPTGSQSARASWSLGIAIGVLSSIEVPFIEVTPAMVKIASGDKTNGKEEIIEWAIDKHPNLPWFTRKSMGKIVQVSGKNEHLADAVACIYAGLPHLNRL
jgi:Holliday junction resolvasome RuvABC endonuclease subunit